MEHLNHAQLLHQQQDNLIIDLECVRDLIIKIIINEKLSLHIIRHHFS